MKSVIFFFLALLFFVPGVRSQHLPEGFLYVEQAIPDVQIEVRYFTADNFVGERIDGYLRPRCILSRPAAEALKRVQEELGRFGLGLKIYDAYRPEQAVRHFVRWAGDLQDTRMKRKYYPDVDKKDLFSLGYIADKSSHSRGSTVDLTIISMNPAGTAEELDMGTGFDLFSSKSWPDDPSMTLSQRAHRMLLQVLMKRHGFEPYPREWWHFTLKNEPFPDTYFDFPVR